MTSQIQAALFRRLREAPASKRAALVAGHISRCRHWGRRKRYRSESCSCSRWAGLMKGGGCGAKSAEGLRINGLDVIWAPHAAPACRLAQLSRRRRNSGCRRDATFLPASGHSAVRCAVEEHLQVAVGEFCRAVGVCDLRCTSMETFRQSLHLGL